jgi:arginase
MALRRPRYVPVFRVTSPVFSRHNSCPSAMCTGDMGFPKPGVSDRGVPGALNSAVVGASCKMLAEATAAAAREGQFVLTLGGDHSVATGSIAGLLSARPGLGVVWFDAHAEFVSG